jgi:molybdopterin-guanine dinucleotide biosynthesis protein A
MTLVDWVAGQAREASCGVTLVGAPDRYGHLGIPCLPERFPGCGPLSGIEAALRQSGPEWRLILACDMPGLTAAFLRGLLDAASSSSSGVVAAAHADGAMEPLCAVYRTCLHGAVLSALERGEYAVRRLLASGLDVVHYPIDSEMLTRNVNTAEEWASWSR